MLVRWLTIVALVLLVPIIPFLLFGEALEPRIESWFESSPPQAAVAAAIVGVLAVDVFLPVPSSFVSTLAGSTLGFGLGTLASFVGMTIGAVFAFGLARTLGWRLAARLASREDLSRMQQLTDRIGPAMVVVTRPLPVLAEAAVLLLGTTGLPWRRFLPAMLLSNLGISAAYAALGHFAWERDSLTVALVASIAVPVLATLLSRRLLPVARQAP